MRFQWTVSFWYPCRGLGVRFVMVCASFIYLQLRAMPHGYNPLNFAAEQLIFSLRMASQIFCCRGAEEHCAAPESAVARWLQISVLIIACRPSTLPRLAAGKQKGRHKMASDPLLTSPMDRTSSGSWLLETILSPIAWGNGSRRDAVVRSSACRSLSDGVI